MTPNGFTSLEGTEIMTDFSDVRIFLCTTPTNMHWSFDRLMGRAQEVFDQDPASGHLFLFLNRDRDRLKILFWDRDGFCIWYKRLEEGTFRFPAPQEGQTCVTISAAEWAMLLDGVDFTNVRRGKRYRRPA